MAPEKEGLDKLPGQQPLETGSGKHVHGEGEDFARIIPARKLDSFLCGS
jgi:hypothetical protein